MHRVDRIHQLEVEMRSGRVAGMADATEHVAVPYSLARRDRNRAGRQVGESGKDVATPHDHVIAEERPQSSRAERHGVLERHDQLAQRMDPASLGDTIGGAHDLAVERCMDLGTPGVAVAGPYADKEPAEDTGGVIAQTGASRVDLEQVVGEPLAKHVGAVARDAFAGRVDSDPPLAPQREVDDDSLVELVRHGLMLVIVPPKSLYGSRRPGTHLAAFPCDART
jgi:hypothetical protein